VLLVLKTNHGHKPVQSHEVFQMVKYYESFCRLGRMKMFDNDDFLKFQRDMFDED
jgi:hypothetical protein